MGPALLIRPSRGNCFNETNRGTNRLPGEMVSGGSFFRNLEIFWGVKNNTNNRKIRKIDLFSFYLLLYLLNDVDIFRKTVKGAVHEAIYRALPVKGELQRAGKQRGHATTVSGAPKSQLSVKGP
jgi:hypothetical protein